MNIQHYTQPTKIDVLKKKEYKGEGCLIKWEYSQLLNKLKLIFAMNLSIFVRIYKYLVKFFKIGLHLLTLVNIG